MGSNFGLSENQISEFFQSAAMDIGANCGILVWETGDQSGFEERASFGYEDQGFFYSFLARGQGNLERMKSQEKPLVFAKDEYPLFLEDSEFAVSAKITEGDRFVGFVLLEHAGNLEQSTMTTYLLAKALSKPLPKKVPTLSANEFGSIRAILDSDPVFAQTVQTGISKKVLYVYGSSASGKKTLSKYLHKSSGGSGEILIIGTIPEQLGKLEKSILSWEQMVEKSGSLVFENSENLTLGQQRIFYEWLTESDFLGKVIFLGNGRKPREPYSPFWEILEDNQIQIKSFSQLGRSIQTQIVQNIFQELSHAIGRENLGIEDEVIEFIIDKMKVNDLENLRNILSTLIWTAKSNPVRVSDIGEKPSDNQAVTGLPDSEDLDLPKCIEALERQKIMLAFKLFSGNQLRMAKALKISRGSLQYKMKNLGLS
ncbi:helix-turn-helix domain-containing protein [Leptospira sp. GIMC2001]|uniref:helix-turn-helix domain-containing protein n=1 Tax=Leptospira sp. GIMC2001 TaxID=1513297 RepID=UPI00234B9618|nr:helix-turn-helix domain-containing protein [Leptospira sp. GIMC2001]WCL47673.1 hypothetical protein O4O04_01515 [Leptospira sp. GIMC2001]